MKRAFISIHKNTPVADLLMKRIACLLFLFLMASASFIHTRNSSNLSIYEYLKADSHFNTYIRLIDDLNSAEPLTTTGNKTLFAVNDSAFAEFFKNNSWNVSTYEQLTVAQKNYLLKFSMIDNAYTLSGLSNYVNSNGLLMHGQAMRRMTSLAVLDSIPYLSGSRLPSGKYWDSRRSGGIYALCDNTDIPTVFFTQDFINNYSLTDKDLKMIAGIDSRSYNDVHIFNDKIIQRDIACNNGYINVLQRVLTPPKNMAQFISDNKNGDASQTTTIFSKLLDRFCAPYFDASSTLLYNQLHPEFTDSIFVKHYFAANGGVQISPTGYYSPNLLIYDPGWNSYTASSGALYADMGAMFVPSDEAMTNYLNSGVGAILKNSYGSWDNVPDEIIVPVIKRCMRTSLINSVPSKFSEMVDAQSYRLPVAESDIVKTYTGVNGVVYVTNKVYAPGDYTYMCSPLLFSDNSKIMNWAINILQAGVNGAQYAFYKLYLNSSAAN